MKILIPDLMTAESRAAMARQHEVIYEPTLVTDLPALLRAAPQADCLIVRNRTQVRGKLLDALTRCRVVGRLGVGLDNIDLEGCAARGIEVIPATGANALAVAEYVVTAALMLLRPWFAASASVLAGEWPRAALVQGHEVAGRTLGIVGFGSIGRETARLGAALGMKVIACDNSTSAATIAGNDVRAVSFDELLATSDVVSLHMPLTAGTRNLFDARALAAMKPGAILINAARGGIVDEAALARALCDGHLAGAALDVFDTEPLGARSPLVGAPNLLVSPHIAGVTEESETRVCNLVARRVIEALAAQRTA
ncbi:(S)-sulfolactate dehydrogenase [Paraburkholderia sp. GAS199]|uniref:hydroxyacid dehydrogenase n=1 Tax=Paraburkholderia sp. GAS199 TaxID=3035126 RepID=UPI003D233E8B